MLLIIHNKPWTLINKDINAVGTINGATLQDLFGKLRKGYPTFFIGDRMFSKYNGFSFFMKGKHFEEFFRTSPPDEQVYSNDYIFKTHNLKQPEILYDLYEIKTDKKRDFSFKITFCSDAYANKRRELWKYFKEKFAEMPIGTHIIDMHAEIGKTFDNADFLSSYDSDDPEGMHPNQRYLTQKDEI